MRDYMRPTAQTTPLALANIRSDGQTISPNRSGIHKTRDSEF